MPAAHAIGLDWGGGSIRCLLLDLETGDWCCEAAPITPEPSPGTGGLGFELDLPRVEATLPRVVARCLSRAGVSPVSVRALACTSQRHSTVVVDDSGAALLATPNRDARAAGAGLRLAAEHGAALHALSGHWPLPILLAARLQWLRDERPASFASARWAMTASEWLAWRLSGVAAADPTHAGESLLFGLTERRWSEQWVERLGLSTSMLPGVVEPGTRLGPLRPEASQWLGLPEGIDVVAGAADTQSGLLGCGAIAPGQLAVVAGTTAPVQRVVDATACPIDPRVWSGQHVTPATRILESNAGPVGDTIEWLAELLHPTEPMAVARFLAEAASAPAGEPGAISTLGAEVMNAQSPRLPFGVLGLSPMAMPGGEDARAVLSRSVLEGIVCALRANAEQLEQICGPPAVEPIVLTGGLSRSPSFAQIAANLLGAPVAVSDCSEASALGAALCAATGAGVFEDLEHAARVSGASARLFEPEAESGDRAVVTYAAWCEQHEALAPAAERAAQRATGAALARGSAPRGTAPQGRSVRILATSQLDGDSQEGLAALGELTYASYRDVGRLLREEALVEALQGVEIFVTEIDVVDAASIAALPALRVIVCCRGDAVNVDVDAATLHGVPVLHTPGRNADAVADLTVAFLLMLSRKLADAAAFLRQGDIEGGDLAKFGEAYSRFRGNELWGKTVGLVGLGAVGRQVARRLTGFGVRLVVSDPFLDAEQAARHGAELLDFEELLAVSDFVSLHAPVTDATRGMMNDETFARMKPGASLINTARAALLDESALARGLEDGRLGGAALDVFAVEPPGSDHPLLALPSVIATPHMGGNTSEVSAHQGGTVIAELGRLLAGERPRHLLNPAVFEDFRWDEPRAIPSEAALASLGGSRGPAVTDLERDAKPSK
jgi:autoinducer 2 (AI-2) kinase